LRTAEVDAATTALRAVVEHRDDLVKTRTQTVNRLHVVLAVRRVLAGVNGCPNGTRRRGDAKG
jgi:hypothetical protein